MAGLASGVAYVLLSAVVGGVGLPFGVPPEPEDPVMGRIAPEHCVFYATWSGTASPDLKNPNQTEQLLAEPEVQYFLTQISSFFKTGIDKALCGDDVTKALQDDFAKAMREAIEYDPGDKKFFEYWEWRKDFVEIFGQAIYRPGAVYFAMHPADPNDEAKTPASETEKQAEISKDAIGKMLKELPQNVSGDAIGKIDADFDPAFARRLEGGVVLSLGPDSLPIQQRIRTFAEKAIQKINDASNDKGQDEAQDKDQKEAQDGDQAKEKAEEKSEKKGEAKFVSKNETDWCACIQCEGCSFFIGIHDRYLIAAIGKDPFDRIVARMEQSPPQWWSKIQEQLPFERRSSIAYANFDLLKELVQTMATTPGEIAAYQKKCEAIKTLGLENVKGWIHVAGLDGSDFASKSLFLIDGEPQGILGAISNQPLQLDDLNPIPADAFAAAAFRFDLPKVLEAVSNAVEKLGPEAQANAKLFLAEVEDVEKNLSLPWKLEDFKSLGDTWCIYCSTDEGMWPILVVSVRDWDAMNTTYLQGMEALKKAAPPRPDFGINNLGILEIPELEQFRFADTDVYCLNVGVAPSWCLTKQAFVLGVSPQSIKSYLARDARYESISRQPRVAELFAQGKAPTALFYCDSRPFAKYLYSYLGACSPGVAKALRGFGVSADASLLPSPAAIYRHLGPSLTTLSRTQYGIEWTAHDTLPISPVNSCITYSLLSSLSDIVSDKPAVDTPAVDTPAGDSPETPAKEAAASTSGPSAVVSTSAPSNAATEAPLFQVAPNNTTAMPESQKSDVKSPSTSDMQIVIVPASIAPVEKKDEKKADEKVEEKKAEEAKNDSPAPGTDQKPVDQKPKD
jgi:hypothetical protein